MRREQDDVQAPKRFRYGGCKLPLGLKEKWGENQFGFQKKQNPE